MFLEFFIKIIQHNIVSDCFYFTFIDFILNRRFGFGNIFDSKVITCTCRTKF